ncbi:MAG TPA: hypothetical protein VFG42_20595 [Baekduia sp.]|uniref:hypothetical protein n=1 Tax=Baekduia sp. TaxID=2600305 RepID=UPI002D7780E2|nr:hypothetical protein [Baekduia sp.]HET6509207.1 hypothetical protein [Baekduia sp.]
MADRVLVLSWGQNVRGREQRGLEVFQEALTYYSELEASGRIEAYDVMLLAPNGPMSGAMVLHGTHAQLQTVAEDERFRRLIIEANLVVEDLRMASGYSAEGIPQTLPLYAEAVGRVPQMA